MSRSAILALRYACFTLGLFGFTGVLYLLERRYGGGAWIAYLFLFLTLAVYAVIGMLSRTSNPHEYYLAGQRVPAVFNGMATAADWLSAASFIGLAGSLFATGYQGLAYIVGWTGGFCLVAVLLAPYVRKMSRYTIPDFLASRYDSGAVRIIAVVATMLCSFVYLVAQIQGVGLIAAHFIGVDVSVGIVFGLAGILVCSFLGGMRAVTWTQVAQYVILIVAMLLTVSLVGHRAGLGWVPQLHYGQVYQRVAALEADLRNGSGRGAGEPQARAAYRRAADVLQQEIDGLPASWTAQKQRRMQAVTAARERNASLREIGGLQQFLDALPASPEQARRTWARERDALLRQAQAPASTRVGRPDASGDSERPRGGADTINFIALVMSLTLGTASLPHILTRYATAPNVGSARSAVGWTLFFISLFYLSVPVLALLVKLALMESLPGRSLAHLPDWIVQWQQATPPTQPLVRVDDLLHDGILHWAGLAMQPDMVVLAAPEIAGLPYVITGLIAAGALAAALSTADGLLLTIANVLSHDVYYKLLASRSSAHRQVMLSKFLLLGVALAAAWLASMNGGDILFIVGAAFSLAASGLFPALVLGVFWERMTTRGAVAAMVAGLAVCVYYLFRAHPSFAHVLHLAPQTWFRVAAGSAGVFGVPVGFVVGIAASLCDTPPGEVMRERVRWMRLP
ncbi:VC_2705 family sodium/solute symporter [Robbsia sp. KACC 23696]|uniref:VC_2705 family sodium/solute symporter n=1 Tax=Robbsia sp. KACC 23696 TaxID=3149231 RepID=UPI00325B9480